MIATTNPKRNTAIPFKVGDKVMLSTKTIRIIHAGCNKLLPRWAGPFTITQRINTVAFRLDLPHTMEIYDAFHTSLLKHYKHDPLRDDGESPPLIIDGHGEFEVETLLGRRHMADSHIPKNAHNAKLQNQHTTKLQTPPNTSSSGHQQQLSLNNSASADQPQSAAHFSQRDILLSTIQRQL
jgi:hypothetical protein